MESSFSFSLGRLSGVTRAPNVISIMWTLSWLDVDVLSLWSYQ
jgi:hypothetical protein